ncbi:MAG: hypothetical protein CMM05_06760 [Rhodopirellula sp.]|nr:hypothetical protein [Rhodopirellula sp.]
MCNILLSVGFVYRNVIAADRHAGPMHSLSTVNKRAAFGARNDMVRIDRKGLHFFVVQCDLRPVRRRTIDSIEGAATTHTAETVFNPNIRRVERRVKSQMLEARVYRCPNRDSFSIQRHDKHQSVGVVPSRMVRSVRSWFTNGVKRASDYESYADKGSAKNHVSSLCQLGFSQITLKFTRRRRIVPFDKAFWRSGATPCYAFTATPFKAACLWATYHL